jgi:hypothetical protein
MARRYRTVFRRIQQPPARSGSVTLAPPRQTSPWPRLVDDARSRAYPGREFAAVCEIVRAYRGEVC